MRTRKPQANHSYYFNHRYLAADIDRKYTLCKLRISERTGLSIAKKEFKQVTCVKCLKKILEYQLLIFRKETYHWNSTRSFEKLLKYNNRHVGITIKKLLKQKAL